MMMFAFLLLAATPAPAATCAAKPFTLNKAPTAKAVAKADSPPVPKPKVEKPAPKPKPIADCDKPKKG